MNLLTFDEIIRLLEAKDLGLITNDGIANQILKYKEMEETNKSPYDFEVRSIFIDDIKSKKEIREKVLEIAKRLDKEENKVVTSQNENFPFIGFTRNIYKKNLKTNEYIKIGYIDSNNVLEFYGFNQKTKPFVPNLYDSDWYVIDDTFRSADGNVYPIYTPVTPNFIEQHPLKSNGVMGYRAKNGRIVYYDYFISE